MPSFSLISSHSPRGFTSISWLFFFAFSFLYRTPHFLLSTPGRSSPFQCSFRLCATALSYVLFDLSLLSLRLFSILVSNFSFLIFSSSLHSVASPSSLTNLLTDWFQGPIDNSVFQDGIQTTGVEKWSPESWDCLRSVSLLSFFPLLFTFKIRLELMKHRS